MLDTTRVFKLLEIKGFRTHKRDASCEMCGIILKPMEWRYMVYVPAKNLWNGEIKNSARVFITCARCGEPCEMGPFLSFKSGLPEEFR